MKETHVTVIVPVFNGAATIARCLESLQAQDYPSFDILVVDNGSTDETPRLVSLAGVNRLQETARGSYTARNAGLRAAEGPWIWFVDSDCVAPPDALSSLAAAMLRSGAAAVGGQIKSEQTKTVVERFSDLSGVLEYSLPSGPVVRNPDVFLSGGLVTANLLCKKSVLLEVGGFESSLRSGGDYELCWRILRQGYTLYFEPAVVLGHFHRTNLPALVRQYYTYGRWQPRLLKKLPERRNFLRIKTFVWPNFEIGFPGPIPMLVDIDFLHWTALFGLCMWLVPFTWVAGVACMLVLLAGAGVRIWKSVIGPGKLRWVFLFPALHIVRSTAFLAGRIWGGVREGVVAC